ncbi:hypothetical protein [Bacillus sp. MRMR6]|uniref:hypothetical protein n=1 Tax=Bacillus sp. MRMR6 TaxID=1928617 RepID=UPI0009523C3E|nr:hypothetical protein [Bacillus sp. MRMR6]OLS33586.1 hypothetical protein BTR25_25160 [Bacillus sp. MRMR6]
MDEWIEKIKNWRTQPLAGTAFSFFTFFNNIFVREGGTGVFSIDFIDYINRSYFLFIRKDKEQILDSFSLGEFLNNNNLVNENKSIVSHLNDFFDTDSDDGGGDGNDADDGGE